MNDIIGCDKVTTVVSLWGRGALVGLFLLISTSKHITSKAATEASVRMRAAREQDIKDSVAGGYSPAAADEQPATPIVAGARGHPRAASSPADSAASGSPMDCDPDIEVIYSGESDFPSDSKLSAKPDRTVADTETAAPRGSLDPEMRRELFGLSDEFDNSSPGSSRSRSYSDEANVQQKDVSPCVDVDVSVRRHRSHSRDSGAGYLGTTQEQQDRDAILSAPERKPWMPSLKEQREW